MDIYLEITIYDEIGNEKKTKWCGTIAAAANMLEMLEIDYETIEM